MWFGEAIPVLLGGVEMRKRSIVSVILSLAAAASMVAVGLVAVPGISQAAKTAPPYYLSLGDSYSIGYQPGLPGGGGSPGYTAYVAKKEKMTLENFGCGGATTLSIISTSGCTDPAATDAVPYTSTQEAAALAFIAANPGQVGLVTVSISGNDVTACGTNPNPVGCVLTALTAINLNVKALVTDLRSALDSNQDATAKIIGLTYPDVLLGNWVYPTVQTTSTLAGLSVLAFDSFINPALKTIYTGVAHGGFVNVTSAPYKQATSGDDTDTINTSTGVSTGPTMKLKPYGVIPTSVWEICQLTYFCSQGNIHANTEGYQWIGKQIVAAYPTIS